jgi:hypothetical protein
LIFKDLDLKCCKFQTGHRFKKCSKINAKRSRRSSDAIESLIFGKTNGTRKV